MKSNEKPLILVVLGPTAVGKTETALTLAQELQAEIISADSMQVYRGMNIGTAKPSKFEQELVPHHLIDVVDPEQKFTVAEYVELAEEAINKIVKRGNLPLITGGTGLYINALIDGFLFPDYGANPKLRSKLRKQAADNPQQQYEQLKQVDPVSAQRLHPHDSRRIVRALEVYHSSGTPISELQAQAREGSSNYRPLMIGLNRNRQYLYQRIEDRVDRMITNGLIAEVTDLLSKYPDQPTALQAIGYKEIAWYLNGTATLEEAITMIKRGTKRYAKRQLSWFRRDKRIAWNDVDEVCVAEIVKSVQEKIISY